ncbi:unnamed protein product [Sphagnum balticum]
MNYYSPFTTMTYCATTLLLVVCSVATLAVQKFIASCEADRPTRATCMKAQMQSYGDMDKIKACFALCPMAKHNLAGTLGLEHVSAAVDPVAGGAFTNANTDNYNRALPQTIAAQCNVTACVKPLIRADLLVNTTAGSASIKKAMCQARQSCQPRRKSIGYTDTDAYKSIAKHEYEPWHELERDTGLQFVYKTGGIAYVDAASGRVEYDKLRTVYDRAEREPIDGCERLTAADIRRRWPQLHVDSTAIAAASRPAAVYDASDHR